MVTFDGSSGSLASPAAAAYNLPQALTIAFWAYLSTLPGASARYVFNQSDLTPLANFRACEIFSVNNAPNTGYFWQFWRNTGSNATPFGSLFQPGSWQHVVAWCDGASEQTFVNGKPNGGTTVGIGAPQSFTSSVLNIGADSATFWQGSLAEFGLWTAALTPDEIFRLANGAPANTVRPLSLLAYLPLDQIQPSLVPPALPSTASGGVTIGPTPSTLVQRAPLLGARL